MFLAIPLEAGLDRRRPYRRDLLAVMVSVLGLAAFLLSAQPRPGVADPSTRAWLGAALGCSAAVAVCLSVARTVPGTVRGTLLGIATGTTYAFAVSLLKVSITEAKASGAAGLFSDWHVYALVLVSRHDALRHDASRHDASRHGASRHDASRHGASRHRLGLTRAATRALRRPLSRTAGTGGA